MAFDPTPGFSLGISRFFKNVGNTVGNATAGFASGGQIASQSGVGSDQGFYQDMAHNAQTAGQDAWNRTTGATSSTPQSTGAITFDAPTTGATSGGSGGSSTAGGGLTAEQQYMQNLRNQLFQSRDNVLSSARDAFGGAYNRFNTQGRSLVDDIRTGQQAIDRSRQNTELQKLNSLSGLADALRTGIRSGQTELAGLNALDSSAADMMARAYANIGTQQRSDIFNQAALGQREIGFEQDALDRQRAEGLRQLNVFKDEEKNRIGSDVERKLQALNIEAAQAGIGGIENIAALRQQVIDEGIARLREVDNFVQERLGGINPQAQAAYQAEANRLRTIGRPEGGFNFGNLRAQAPNPAGQLPVLGRPQLRDDER